jgi:hypothetical protein
MFIFGTYDDFINSGWNTLVASAPFFAGMGAAWGINMISRKVFKTHKPSTLMKGCAFVIGAAVSVPVALRMPQLVPFSGGQIFKLWFCPFAMAGTTMGYFGQRSLFVVGFGAAYIGTSNLMLGFFD